MKRTVIAFVLLAGLAAIPAMAQDFESPKPQLFSFSIGVPIGYDLALEDAVSGTNFGLNIAVAENFEVGFDRLMGSNYLRAGFFFNDKIGAAIGIGGDGINTKVTLGITGTFIQARASNGIAYNFGIRLDFVAPDDSDFADGAIVFVLRTSFGL